MALHAAPNSRRSQTRRSPLPEAQRVAEKAPPARSSSPAEDSLARARRLGHDVARLEAPSPVPVRGNDSAAQIRRAVGFELELQVLLSNGKPTEPPQGSEYPEEIGDLKSGKIQPRPKVKETRHTVVLADGSTFEWREASDAADDGETVIRPANVQETEPGRWVRKIVGEQGQYFDPLLKKEEKIYREEKVLDVVEDHAPESLMPGGKLQSLPEFVTAPRDEGGSQEEFLAPIQRAESLTKQILMETEALKKRVPAKKVFPGARGDLYLGYDLEHAPKSLNETIENPQSPRASIQATYAVRLDAVPEYVTSLASSKRTQAAEGKILGKASQAAQTAYKAVLSKNLISSPDPGLFGLIQVLSLYLSGGSSEFAGDMGGNVKNYVPLLNRYDIDMYVLQPGFLGPQGVKLLRYMARRQGFIQLLAEANGRGLGEPVLTIDKGTPTVGSWLAEVLTGEGDSLRSYSRFGRARRIQHEKVGSDQTLAPVFEERQVPSPKEVLGRSDLVPVDQWTALALDIRKKLLQANQPGGKESGEDASSSLPSLNVGVQNLLASSSKVIETPPPVPKKGDMLKLTHKKEGTAFTGSFLAAKQDGTWYIVGKGLINPKDYDVEIVNK